MAALQLPSLLPEKGKSPEGTLVVEKGADGHWKISSDNGVWVNNRKQNQTVLENGDVIRAGNELIVFDDGEE